MFAQVDTLKASATVYVYNICQTILDELYLILIEKWLYVYYCIYFLNLHDSRIVVRAKISRYFLLTPITIQASWCA
jgi:hypothetical protein